MQQLKKKRKQLADGVLDVNKQYRELDLRRMLQMGEEAAFFLCSRWCRGLISLEVEEHARLPPVLADIVAEYADEHMESEDDTRYPIDDHVTLETKCWCTGAWTKSLEMKLTVEGEEYTDPKILPGGEIRMRTLCRDKKLFLTKQGRRKRTRLVPWGEANPYGLIKGLLERVPTKEQRERLQQRVGGYLPKSEVPGQRNVFSPTDFKEDEDD